MEVVLWRTLALLALVIVGGVNSANYYSKGREFMLAFLYNHHFGPNPTKANFLFISSDQPGQVTVEMEAAGGEDAFIANHTLKVGGTIIIPLPDRSEMPGSTGQERKGVSVISSVDVSVFAMNEDSQETSEDAHAVLPVQSLSTTYFVPSVWSNPVFAVVGVLSNTQVEINLKSTCRVSYNGNHFDSGDKFTARLNSYDVFQVYTDFSNASTCDLGGTKIIANNPVAVFSGSSCAVLTQDGCDHVVEQIPPVEHWGRQFIVPDLYDNNNYRVRVLASQDFTRIFTTEFHADGTSHNERYGMDAGECKDFDVPDGSMLEILSYSPIHVSQYDTSYAPFVIPIPSLDHFGWNYTLPTMDNTFGRTYLSYVNVVIKTKHRDSLLLDGSQLGGPWREVHDLGYSIRSLHVSKGTHQLVADEPFLAQVYGYYVAGSYGYQGGYGFKSLPSAHISLTSPSGATGGPSTGCVDYQDFDCKLFDQTLNICTDPQLGPRYCARYCKLCGGAPVVGR